MFTSKSRRAPTAVTGQAFGVGVSLTASDAKLMALMLEWLPPQWEQDGIGIRPVSLRLTRTGSDAYELQRDGFLQRDLPLDQAIRLYEWSLRNHIAATAPDHVFVHAGVVARDGKAIVIPGPSFSGKSTLVAAMVGAGATYFSDEYAVFDASGLVHPYPKHISIRTEGVPAKRTNQHPHSLGAAIATDPAPVGLVLVTQYRRAAQWHPVALTPAQSTLELMKHSFAAEARAPKTIATLAAAVERAVALKGDRGDADAIAASLLASPFS